ncbi:hypothetical protein [Salisediminibacterium halotolerans]|uniref:hypothetical protein n=1 Tax=Salisediminibacterium halotolerans TaxID=517425 RepID=UPI000EB514E3|nr:hypothetical protein [Salisediminibacterium halotolerans]RLJ78321.1 hypothetical protein BCL39_0793 [Actinophytocola xinjiangensis]RPE88340.1 hypothetical protein EDD67_0666 [Salisediminibacterium halotolerans]TWG37297.1 hypothetical protein BCL52_0791 [Salisediminibacterium halotolerans]GEL08761.1 SPBc2 prophage-derived uncharacterized lipoprotein YonS [Salisediminibacterium halotolerans]
MKRILLGLSVTSLLVIAACGEANNGEVSGDNANDEVAANDVNNETNLNENIADPDNEQEAANNLNDAADEFNEDGWETEVGDTVQNEAGTFTLHARADDIDAVDTGPVLMEIEQVTAQSGELSAEYARLMEMDEVQLVQMDIAVENTSDEDIIFYSAQPRIATSTGEQLDPDFWLSDYIEGDMMAGTKAYGTLFFVLENSEAEEIESVRATWSPPYDQGFAHIGDEVDIEIDL